jgi:hypothetical protein
MRALGIIRGPDYGKILGVSAYYDDSLPVFGTAAVSIGRACPRLTLDEIMAMLREDACGDG